MEADLIKQIANQVVKEQILLNWKFYMILASLYFLVYCLASFIKPYLGKRGEALAKKSDLGVLLNELRKSTELTENIKSKVDTESWILKEFNILKRQKLEELLILLYDYKMHINSDLNAKFFGGVEIDKRCPSDQATAIHKLYFPELDEPMKAFYRACAKWGEWLSEGLKQKQVRMANGQAIVSDGKTICTCESQHMDKYGDVLNDIYFSIKAVEDQAKLVMDELRNI